MTKYTVFFDQVNRTNVQVKADNEDEALIKATNLYKNQMEVPAADVQDGWLSEEDGEDK